MSYKSNKYKKGIGLIYLMYEIKNKLYKNRIRASITENRFI